MLQINFAQSLTLDFVCLFAAQLVVIGHLYSFIISNILALLLASVGEIKYRKVSEKIKQHWR
jgi:hypothetical protein